MSNERPENPVSSVPTEGQKKKRGRPRKQPQEDTVERLSETKPRGRPKGSKKRTTVTEETAEPSAEKRGRGRPRKWPQAVVKEGESQEEDPQARGDSNLNSAPATQVSSGAPAPISLPATESGSDISGAAGSRVLSSPAAIAPNHSHCITGKRGSRPGKTAGLKRSQSTIPATAQ